MLMSRRTSPRRKKTVFTQGQHTVYRDLKQPRPRMYQEYRPGNRALLYTRNPRLTDKEDCCLHFLMLYIPTRVDTDKWLEMSPARSMFELARVFFGDDRLQRLIPGILDGETAQLVAFGEQQEQQGLEKHPMDQLSPAQKALVDAIVTTPGPFVVTGAAGTGKSTVLTSLVHRLRNGQDYEPIVLAPSAIAALHVHGQTIHSYFGLFRPQDIASRAAYSLDAKVHTMDKEHKRKPFFIVDEASMLGRDLFEGLSDVANKDFQNPSDLYKPFGGAPIVMFGDFGQLGPIVKDREAASQWIFQSSLFGEFTRIRLNTVHRQAQDPTFIQTLLTIRNGPSNQRQLRQLVEVLQGRAVRDIAAVINKVIYDGAIFITCTRAKAKELNAKCLEQLPSNLFKATATDTRIGGALSDWKQDQIERETGLDTTIYLKIGARVMITANLDIPHGLVNGSMATVLKVEGFLIIVKMAQTGAIAQLQRHSQETLDGRQCRKQFPITLAYAMTVHRVQSLTLDRIIVDLLDTFASGQAYVALSRVHSLNDLEIYRFPESWDNLFPDPVVKQHL